MVFMESNDSCKNGMRSKYSTQVSICSEVKMAESRDFQLPNWTVGNCGKFSVAVDMLILTLTLPGFIKAP